MGDTAATAKNGFERIIYLTQYMARAAQDMDDLADGLSDDDMMLFLTALAAETVSLGARLSLFVRMYREELECISIDQ